MHKFEDYNEKYRYDREEFVGTDEEWEEWQEYLDMKERIKEEIEQERERAYELYEEIRNGDYN